MKYYLNLKSDLEDGYHEVHSENCFWIPKPDHRIYLGEFMGEEACCHAVKEALKIYPKIHGCKQCCCGKNASYELYDYCEL